GVAACSAISLHDALPIYLLRQKFQVKAPNLVWCTDFTYIRLSNGKMRYNCTVMDLYDRSVVSSLNSEHINTELAKAAVEKALGTERDRKSTRLNSSHVSTSYAVFCLKKKKVQMNNV